MKKLFQSYAFMLIAIMTGIFAAFLDVSFIALFAESIKAIFMNFLKLIATPIVFLAIVATISNMQGLNEMQNLGKRVFGYTLFTTLLAASVSLALFLIIDPAKNLEIGLEGKEILQNESYFSFFLNIMPGNFVQAFLENNVIGVALIGFLLGIAILKLPKENSIFLSSMFSSLFKALLKVAEFITIFIPLAIWAFTFLLVKDLRGNFGQFHSLVLYLTVVILANIIQGFVVIPIILKMKGISPIKTAKGSINAILLAFFSKSSNATLPLSMEVAEKKLGISSKVASFSLPLCTVINMNGCAAFILATVLFVSKIYGINSSPIGLVTWIFLATLAAIGNAGVPMGCFFLSSTFLLWMNVPLTMMALILPFYAFLDMIETALNVWSDISVTAILDKELKQSERKRLGEESFESKCSA
ncbi:MAG: dicarboxylate/amino acid:cation symporter [Chlamydiae bacterium]|nr:dicarboxylate/amino acid:cation symporter [Chlamydiota bacterium]